MTDGSASKIKMFIRYTITSALVLLFMGIWWFEALTAMIKEWRVPDLMLFFAMGFGSSLTGFVVIHGIEWIKGGESFSWGLYILFSSVLSLVILGWITHELTQWAGV